MKRLDIDVDNLVRRYLAGESEKRLSDSLGVSRTAIRRRLLEAGIEPRGRSEAELLKWSQMTPAQRRAQTMAAHDASRGSTQPTEAKIQRAQTTASAWEKFITSDERQLMDWLVERGIPVVPQQAVHIYNCDLGAFPVAVEIFGGHWHWHGHHKWRLSERFRDFFDRGWHVFVVHVRKPDHSLSKGVVDHIVSYYDFARRNPTAPREYRMVRGDAEPFLVCTENDEIPDEYPFRNRRNPVNGRYESVPWNA